MYSPLVLKDSNISQLVLKGIRRYQVLKAFSKVLDAYTTEWKSISPVALNYGRAQEAAKMVIEEPLVNFRRLSVLSIWVDKDFGNFTIEGIENKFGGKISRILSEHNLV